MYRIMKDNRWADLYILQKRYFGFLWVTVFTESLDLCRGIRDMKENPGPKYTFVE